MHHNWPKRTQCVSPSFSNAVAIFVVTDRRDTVSDALGYRQNVQKISSPVKMSLGFFFWFVLNFDKCVSSTHYFLLNC